jgi:hypothetical protein
MELDDLKTAWRDLERRLDESEATTRALRRDIKVDRTRSALRRMAWGQAVMVAIWVAVTVVVAPFWIEHRATTHLLLAGAALHLYALMGIISCVIQIAWIASIDHAAPVLALQRKLAVLRRTRILSQLVLGLPMWVLWVVATMVGAMWLLDIDLYARSPGWIQLNLLIGVAGIILSLWLPRRLGRTARGSRFVQRVLDDLAGRSLVRVTRELDELASFSRE